LDAEGREDNRKLADEHRNKIIAGIKNFSIETHSYKIVDGKMQAEKPSRIKLGDAADCLNRIVWSKDGYAQGFDEEKLMMKVFYIAGGAERKAEFDIVLPKSNEFWRFGILFDSAKLTLSAYLGSDAAHTQTENIPLALA
jgi:hypothetical protein